MHSKDFSGIRMLTNDGKIGGLTQEQWEAEFGIVGMIHHLRGLGWVRHQWDYTSKEDREKFHAEYAKERGKAPPRPLRCFAEFFSDTMHGYLRGDGDTVREAVSECLQAAQRYAACERGKGHAYVPFKLGPKGEEYTNGLMMCSHCGFGGYTTIVTAMQQKIIALESHVRVTETMASERVRYAELHGESMHSAMSRRLEKRRAEEDAMVRTVMTLPSGGPPDAGSKP